MNKIKITADSTCDLSTELLKLYDIDITPLYINTDNGSFKDGVDIRPDDIYEYVNKNKKIPKTAACTVADYEKIFEKWTSLGYDVVHINLSLGFSCTHQNAKIAAESFDNVFVVDSRNLSSGSGHIVIEAAKLAQKGFNAGEIFEAMNKLTEKIEASFVINTLDYLHMGGRCSSIAALGANLLKLKPCIEVKDGLMNVGKKYRGNYINCIQQYVDDRLSGRDDIVADRIFITHTGCDKDIVDAVKAKIAEHIQFNEVIETIAGCTITNHCGPYTLGILFIRK